MLQLFLSTSMLSLFSWLINDIFEYKCRFWCYYFLLMFWITVDIMKYTMSPPFPPYQLLKYVLCMNTYILEHVIKVLRS